MAEENILNQELHSYEDFANARRNGFLLCQALKQQGGLLAGTFCTFTPEEILDAASICSVGLCASNADNIPASEVHLPRNLCPLIKSSYGNILTDRCPYAHFADLIVGETTCDGKKKMYELLGQLKETFVLHLPQGLHRDFARPQWAAELRVFAAYLEERFGRKITEENLRKAAAQRNALRLAKLRLLELQKLCPPPRFGRDLYNVTDGAKYTFDVEKVTAEIDRLRHETQAAYDAGYRPVPETAKRVLITGCPIGGVFEKVVGCLEDNGAVVVCFENCGGIKPLCTQVDTEAEDIMAAIADRYLDIGCSVLTPNDERMKLLRQLIPEYHVDGVLEIVLQGCFPYHVESTQIKALCTEVGVPYTMLETGYSSEDAGQLSTRLAAFVELLEA